MNTDNYHIGLFKNPFLERWKNVGLATTIGIVIVITWLPLLLLSLGHRSEAFMTDASVHMKFLIALPLMLLAPYSIKNKIRSILYHFVESGIVKESDREKYLSYIHSAETSRKSPGAIALLTILVYIGLILVLAYGTLPASGSWRATGDEGMLPLSISGIWFTFVSHAIYSFVQLYFIYNALLWCRLMFLISKLDLQLKASHGDDTAGLIFLSGSLTAFNVPVLAFTTSIAIGALNLVLYKHFSLFDLRNSVIVLVVSLTFLFVAPLIFYYSPLIKIKKQSILSYGALGGYQLDVFEKKWLHLSEQKRSDPSLVESEEFCIVTDTISIVNKVYKMRTIPLTQDKFWGFLLCTVIPFLPILSVEVSWSEIFKKLLMFVM